LKEAWVYLEAWSKELVTTAMENGADAIVLPSGFHDRIKALGRIVTVSPDGDLRPQVDVFFERVQSARDEERVTRRLASGPVVLMDLPQALHESPQSSHQSEAWEPAESPDPRAGPRHPWEVIPLENLIARGGRIIVPVQSPEELELAMTVMEEGAQGVLIQTGETGLLKSMLNRVKAASESVELSTAVIERIGLSGLGDRVCLDTCTLMSEGEGMLVGNSSGFLFLVQAEALPNPYVAPRPFRVNAGPVHAYLRAPGGSTRYLSELQSGDRVLIVRSDGSTLEGTLGRVKIERRPLLLIEARAQGKSGSILVQNAETIRLSRPDGQAVSVVDLTEGDSILVALEVEGRHFGMKVRETIWER
jgi:3-dehydroquinate synthase II